MAEDEKFFLHESTEQVESDSDTPKQPRSMITRRDFLVGTKVGAVAVGVVAGAGFAAGQAGQAGGTAAAAVQRPAQRPVAEAPGTLPLTMRRVTLDIDRKKYDVTVDVRESLWETMNYQLGLSNSNLGCDRAQCGACAVLLDGKAVNGCTVLTARLGRGQKILTVGGIASGPGPEGLHPIQRAFWLDGGFQCGICTRGFVMSTYALLEKTPSPTNEQIKEALSGNICRCGEYTKIINSVNTAAAEMRGQAVSYAAPLVREAAAKPSSAPAAPSAGSASKQFEFVTALSTIEQFDELALELRQRAGIVGVSGTERTVTPVWDPTTLDEAKVRQILAETGHPVKP